ncbi:MAG: hypothetical protein ACHQRJ_25510, partial [Alphaproteobacteria bacterium]
WVLYGVIWVPSVTLPLLRHGSFLLPHGGEGLLAIAASAKMCTSTSGVTLTEATAGRRSDALNPAIFEGSFCLHLTTSAQAGVTNSLLK